MLPMKPIRAGAQGPWAHMGPQGHQGSPWMPEPPSLDYCPDMPALCLQLTLQYPGGAPLSYLGQALASIASSLPHPAYRIE